MDNNQQNNNFNNNNNQPNFGVDNNYAGQPMMQQPVQPEPVMQPQYTEQPMMQQPVQPQPMYQEPVQPMMQQPVQPQYTEQPMMQQNYGQPYQGPYVQQPVNNVPNGGGASGFFKNKKILAICGGVLGVVVLVIVLVLVLGKGSKVVLECTSSESLAGTTQTEFWRFNINDGEVSKIVTTLKIDYRDASNKPSDAIIDSTIELGKKQCEKDNCTFKYNYDKGKSIEMTMEYSKDYTSKALGSRFSNISDLKADEIADKLEDNLGSSFNCKKK